MFFASGLLALLPSIAHGMNGSPLGYGVLVGCFGCGAVFGALVMQSARARWSADKVVTAGIAVFGLVTIAAGGAHAQVLLGLLMLVGGAAWISFLSLFNVQVLNQAPDWVRARVLAVSMLVFQGAAWGGAAARIGIGRALMWAGVGTIATTALGLFLPLPETGVDLSPWNHWRMPSAIPAEFDGEGPVLVTVECYVDSDRVADFMRTIHEYGRVRRRDGASRWGICRDLEMPDRYLENSSSAPGRNTSVSMTV
jgi:hypothetical protein